MYIRRNVIDILGKPSNMPVSPLKWLFDLDESSKQKWVVEMIYQKSVSGKISMKYQTRDQIKDQSRGHWYIIFYWSVIQTLYRAKGQSRGHGRVRYSAIHTLHCPGPITCKKYQIYISRIFVNPLCHQFVYYERGWYLKILFGPNWPNWPNWHQLINPPASRKRRIFQNHQWIYFERRIF